MRASVPLLATSLLLFQTTSAFLTVQKRDRPVALGTSTNTASASVPNNNNPKPLQQGGDYTRSLPPTFIASHGGNGRANPFAVAYEQDYTLWHDAAADDEVDLSYPTIIMACALSMALGFGLGYGT
jgi:hypothetical protein